MCVLFDTISVDCVLMGFVDFEREFIAEFFIKYTYRDEKWSA